MDSITWLETKRIFIKKKRILQKTDHGISKTDPQTLRGSAIPVERTISVASKVMEKYLNVEILNYSEQN